MAKRLADTNQNQIPAAEQIDAFTRLTHELHQSFFNDEVNRDRVLDGLRKLNRKKLHLDCGVEPEIPGWAHKGESIKTHSSCGIVDLSMIAAESVFRGEVSLSGDEYLARVQEELPSFLPLNACARDFFVKSENWKFLAHLPTRIDFLIFPGTVFNGADKNLYVPDLRRIGLEWREGESRIKNALMYPRFLVAVVPK
ncbi:MAG: hypothetical protein ABI430_03725 [Candidatus Taylorbacteria bacterium]